MRIESTSVTTGMLLGVSALMAGTLAHYHHEVSIEVNAPKRMYVTDATESSNTFASWHTQDYPTIADFEQLALSFAMAQEFLEPDILEAQSRAFTDMLY